MQRQKDEYEHIWELIQHGRKLHMRDQYAAALAVFEQAIALDPEGKKSSFLVAWGYEGKAKALAMLKLRLAPQNQEIKTARDQVQAIVLRQQREQAERWIREVVEQQGREAAEQQVPLLVFGPARFFAWSARP